MPPHQKHKTTSQPENKPSPAGQRVQKVLADWGYGSRREIEAWIRQGRVRVNGERAELGQRMGLRSRVQVDSHRLTAPRRKERRLLLYHKPCGEICARRDTLGRRTVFDSLPRITTGRWVLVGRLDYNTSGLLLFTNDGDWAQQLMRARVEREYLVRVHGIPRPESLRRMCSGITLEEGTARFSHLEEIASSGINRNFLVSVKVGWNRVVRRLWEAEGLDIGRLKRVRFASLRLPSDVPPGGVRELPVDCLAEQPPPPQPGPSSPTLQHRPRGKFPAAPRGKFPPTRPGRRATSKGGNPPC